jgi:hypothetical protein
MFEEIRLLGPTERSIIVQTREGTSIENLVELAPAETEQRRYSLLLERFGAHWRERTPATGFYNCAGHVWASRRTAILKPECWQIILKEDGYRSLPAAETPVTGDLVLYADAKGGEYIHVGMVMDTREGILPGSPTIPWVLSKWNSTSGEVMHYVGDVPYGKQGIPTKTEYWTDRASGMENKNVPQIAR